MATYTDNFNRADELPIASPWVNQTANFGLKLSASCVSQYGTGAPNFLQNEDCLCVYSGSILPIGNNQYSQAVVASPETNNGGIGLVVRAYANVPKTSINVQWGDDGKCYGYDTGGGAGSFTVANTVATNDVIRLVVIGTTVTAYKNEVSVGTYETGITTGGNPGFGTFHPFDAGSPPTGRMDNWEGGDWPITGSVSPITTKLYLTRATIQHMITTSV